MKALREEIKNQSFQRVYLLHGEEHYLRNYYRDLLCNAVVPAEDTMNRTVYEENRFTEGEAVDQAETVPFFAERRLLVFMRTGLFKKSSELLADYLKEIPDYAVLVFVEDEIDKRSKLYKAVQKNGRVIEFGIQDEKALSTWILKMITAAGLKITSADMHYFISRVGTDMYTLRLEADKLVQYLAGREIVTREDIEAVTTDRTENRIFDMIAAVTSGNRSLALRLYNDLIEQKETPVGILALMERQYHQLLLMREMLDEGVSSQTFAGKIGMHPYVVKKNLGIVRAGSAEKFRQAFRLCVQTEEDIKSGRVNDRIGIELAIVQLLK